MADDFPTLKLILKCATGERTGPWFKNSKELQEFRQALRDLLPASDAGTCERIEKLAKAQGVASKITDKWPELDDSRQFRGNQADAAEETQGQAAGTGNRSLLDVLHESVFGEKSQTTAADVDQVKEKP